MYPRSVLFCLLTLTVIASPVRADQPALSGAEIVKHCYYKYAGDDQRSQLMIALTDENGKKVKSEYLRLWKNYAGKDGIEDKVILFTQFPPDSKGVNFMRWAYSDLKKNADQWVYLPEMRMVRRVSQRDPNNMDWGFTDEDLRIRALDEDEHVFKEVARFEGGDYYLVESIPKQDPTYGKRVSWFSKADDWQDCLQRRVDYYDKRGELMKSQFMKWERVKDAWVWRTVVVNNSRNSGSAVYDMRNVEVNVGLTDADFTQRTLKLGDRAR